MSTQSIRDGVAQGLIELAEQDSSLFVFCADLTDSLKLGEFKKRFPNRFVQLGVSEQSMATMGAGLALQGGRAVIASYSAFSPGRSWEQVRTTIALQRAPVIILGGHTGITVGEDGATHQILEDIALMRTLPNITVLAPADASEARAMILEAGRLDGPAYIRMVRPTTPEFTNTTSYAIGKGSILREGRDLAIIGCGPLLHSALLASEHLAEEGIECMVVNMGSIKPLDEELLERSAKQCGAILTIEEAQIAGGLGGAIAEYLSENYPVPMLRVGIMDRFGESGDAESLLEHFELTPPHIASHAQQLLQKKTRFQR